MSKSTIQKYQFAKEDKIKTQRDKLRNKLHCPQCKQPIWDKAFASKLNKCWNCGLAFDN